MTKAWQIAVFDVVAPLLSVAAFVIIGMALGWPVWWVSACAALCVLMIESTAVNFHVVRRHGVTVGTDAHARGLQSAVVALTTAALLAAALVGYARWWVPERARDRDLAAVVRLAGSVSEATATFSPPNPSSFIDKAADLMPSDRADSFKNRYGKTARELAGRHLVGQAGIISAGVEVISPGAASVAVIMRTTQGVPGSPPVHSVAALRVLLVKRDGRWTVLEVTPIRGPPTGQTIARDQS